MSAYPSRAPWLHKEGATLDPTGAFRTVAPPHVGTPLARFVAPWGAPPKVTMAPSEWRRRPMSAHPSRVSWLGPGGPHPMFQGRRPHVGAVSFRHTLTRFAAP
eukprot:3466804-Pyramimonas_sp.AAC.2